MIRLAVICFLACVLALASPFGCSRANPGPTESSPRMLVGAGATLPFPLYSKWSAEYARVDPTVRVNYQSIGSGAGIRQVSDGVVDFGATDEPMSDEQLDRAPVKLVHVPTTVGAVVFAFNVPGLRDLALTAEVAADIFLGNVQRWDDARLRALNPNAALPDEPITVVHRADGSGTSAALTTYLATHNDKWSATAGSGTAPRFPVGVGAKGNEGVTAFVKATPLSVGYVELVYARQAGLPMARVKNRAGVLVAPTLDAIDRAAKSVSSTVATSTERVMLLDSADEGAYPIAALSYVVLPRDARDAGRAEALARFLWWAVHDGQRFARDLDYVPLPPALVARAERALRELRVDGRPLLPQAAERW
ncbi:MAG: Phosphate-binding protein PstS [Labilithrix sp.]|nr:Phosphate-binding protein PstS [Labilithrix sp.]